MTMERCIASEIGNLTPEQIEAVREVLDRLEREGGSTGLGCAVEFDEPNFGARDAAADRRSGRG